MSAMFAALIENVYTIQKNSWNFKKALNLDHEFIGANFLLLFIKIQN